MLRLEASKEMMEDMTDGIKPMLDLIDPQLREPYRRPQSDVIMERCRSALENFKHYARGIACTAMGHALVIVWSFYPSTKLERIDGGFAQNLSDEQIIELEEVSDSTIKLVDNFDLLLMLILNHDDM